MSVTESGRKPMCGVFATGYCAATKCIKTFIDSFVESVITKKFYREVLTETLKPSFNRWSRSNTLMSVLLVEKID